ncbi:hypothetical protein FACS1894195_0030 [Bacteroidia bacterium]|nr:hypothetical protein FACS1894195_0030 [Bacteroidia bacterium]
MLHNDNSYHCSVIENIFTFIQSKRKGLSCAPDTKLDILKDYIEYLDCQTDKNRPNKEHCPCVDKECNVDIEYSVTLTKEPNEDTVVLSGSGIYRNGNTATISVNYNRGELKLEAWIDEYGNVVSKKDRFTVVVCNNLSYKAVLVEGGIGGGGDEITRSEPPIPETLVNLKAEQYACDPIKPFSHWLLHGVTKCYYGELSIWVVPEDADYYEAVYGDYPADGCIVKPETGILNAAKKNDDGCDFVQFLFEGDPVARERYITPFRIEILLEELTKYELDYGECGIVPVVPRYTWLKAKPTIVKDGKTLCFVTWQRLGVDVPTNQTAKNGLWARAKVAEVYEDYYEPIYADSCFVPSTTVIKAEKVTECGSFVNFLQDGFPYTKLNPWQEYDADTWYIEIPNDDYNGHEWTLEYSNPNNTEDCKPKPPAFVCKHAPEKDDEDNDFLNWTKNGTFYPYDEKRNGEYWICISLEDNEKYTWKAIYGKKTPPTKVKVLAAKIDPICGNFENFIKNGEVYSPGNWSEYDADTWYVEVDKADYDEPNVWELKYEDCTTPKPVLYIDLSWPTEIIVE